MASDSSRKTRILFVCLGNICRSPLAEGIFRRLAEEAGVEEEYEVESAGTGGWHVGEAPDERMTEVAAGRGVRLEGSAQQVGPDDLARFDLVLAMDRSNLRDIRSVDGAATSPARIRLLREFDPEAGDDLDVPDPYYGGSEGFRRVFEIVDRSCRRLLEELESSPE